ncbi:hypothetical protein MD535_24125 [Vibrio sp. ZSDZ65]|uniref:Uncharacterized protein n=1 Tax=Vibrio qingdaonensis TaxID=2829491 RepID=A0A9X3CSS0_9VIBR|nr:hypothetical protein [Vibrio qingdaonensis]MCW8349082.1 hypothetical protein [Vibrio qingdaonensis]
MEFRFPVAAAEANAAAQQYLTKNLSDRDKGQAELSRLLESLGNSIDHYPDWHPILMIPQVAKLTSDSSINQLYRGADHTISFVRGFVTCPYSEETANKLVSEANQLVGLHAYRTEVALYSDHAYPVVVEAINVELEGDGTIRSRDALAWCVQELVKNARDAQVAETWWNLRRCLLGSPHGSRSSLLVNQFTGGHMRKILEALNTSGIYGPIKEWSLEMFSKKKREKISETLLKAALANYKKQDGEFEFELRGETCKSQVRDTWGDGTELSIRVDIGDYDLSVTGYYYPEKDNLEAFDPKGKKAIAEKFL